MNCSSEISKRMRGQGNADSVQDGGEVDDFLCDGATDWRQVSKRGGDHSQDTQYHPPDGGLKSNTTHAPRDMNQFVYSTQGSLQDNCVSGLGRNIALHSKGNPDRCGLHCRGVVDAIPKEQRRGLRRLLADDSNLVLRALDRVQFRDSNLLG